MFHSWNDIILLFCVCRWTNSLCSCMSWLMCWETSGFIDLQKVLSSFQANLAVSLLEQIASRLLRAFTVSDVCGVFCVAFCFVCLFCKCKSASKPGRILRKKSINGSNLICLIEKWVIYLDFFFSLLSVCFSPVQLVRRSPVSVRKLRSCLGELSSLVSPLSPLSMAHVWVEALRYNSLCQNANLA